jgi:hypothetical protein
VAWEPIKTAPINRLVLFCDDKGNVFIARSSTLRWRADRLIDCPRWWQSLPSRPSEEAPATPTKQSRKSR